MTEVSYMLMVVARGVSGPVVPGPSEPPQLVSPKSSRDNRNEPTLECLTGTASREKSVPRPGFIRRDLSNPYSYAAEWMASVALRTNRFFV